MKSRHLVFAVIVAIAIAVALLFTAPSDLSAYDTYRSSSATFDNCSQCHPGFTDVFSGALHLQHELAISDCASCHQTSNGGSLPVSTFSSGLGPGCVGCHVEEGLRLHHADPLMVPPDLNGDVCLDCHDSDSPPVAENVPPPYYPALGLDPCNADGSENLVPGDGDVGLDNDGDYLYDGDDPDCDSPTGCTSDAECDNGAFCDGAETCDVGTGQCQAGTPVDCADGVSCTVDSCNEGTDSCDNAPDDGFCDNGQFCDGAETCDAAADCQAGTPPCDPATETCDEAGDTCEPIGCTSDAECDNGDFCDGAETCDTGSGQCQPGTPVNVDDGVACTDDSCDEVNDVVVHSPNDGLCDDDAFCNGAETCDAINDCQAGTPVDCSDGVSCTVDSCDEATDSCDNAPNDSLCDNGQFCDGAETCDGVNDCQAGTPVDCSDGVSCTVDSCDETTDSCDNAPNDTLCDDGAFCNGAETCDGVNDCQAGTPVDCSDGVSCTVDSCDETTDSCDNAPNDSLCDNGQFCDGAETCDAINDCQAGTPVDVDDGVGCTDDSCDETNDVVINAPNDGLCDDGAFCNGAETCDAINDCQAGTPVDVDDGVGCTDDSCDETNDVVINAPNDGLCDDGAFCNGAETCDAINDCQAGTPVDVDDGVGCTDDSCDETNDVVVHAPNDGLCDDGAFCNGAETCDAINDCQAGTPVDVDDGVGCTDDSCDETNDVVVNAPNDGFCDNGQFCDGAETCDAIEDCQAGTAVDVDDGVGCTDDSCDETNDVVVNAPNDGLCDNGQFCDGAETCDAIEDCEAGTAVDVDDGVGCTDDSCDETNDVVVNAPNDGLCDNGQFCDGAETCDAIEDCQAGTAVDVDDGVGCTDDSCDETNDVVVNATNDGLCDNGQFCDGAETCDAINDCQAGTAVDCTDAVSCTVDSCNEGTDSCDNAPNDTLCPDDGLFCTGDEFCDPVNDCSSTGSPCDPAVETCDEVGDVCEPIGCQSDAECDNGEFCDGAETCDTGAGECLLGTPVNVDDGVGCTDDSCDETNDVVVNAPNDGFCDNGQFCDGAETCDAINDCQAGTPVDVDDGVGCTEDSCDETNDVVVNAPNDGLCDNGQFCDGSETCDAVNDCQAGTPPCDPATETCDEVGDVCEPIGCQSDGECDNGMFCDGDETCDLGTGQCLPGTPPVVDDGVGCTDDSCDEASDVVVNAPNDGLCDNGQFCDGAELCDPALDCQAGTPVDVDDGVGCTDDSCDEVNDVVVNAPNDGLCSDDGLFCTGAEFCDPVNDCSSTGDPCGPGETCDEDGDVCEPPAEVVDLDIWQFKASKKARLGRGKPKPVRLRLEVLNRGTIDQPRQARIIGLVNGMVVTVFDEMVSDAPGDGTMTYEATYLPTVPGNIAWMATILDDDPDIDIATAVTQVKP